VSEADIRRIAAARPARLGRAAVAGSLGISANPSGR
jgi:hypothetical protein